MSSSNNDGSKPVLLARLDFPPFCLKVISERHFIVAGGGGAKKTGVPNCFDVYELVYDPATNLARINLASRFDNEDRVVMNLDIVPKTKYQFEMLSGGSDGCCYVHDVKLKINSEISGGKTAGEQTPNDANLRRRHFSFSTQQSRDDDLEENIGGGDDLSSKRIPGAAGGAAKAAAAAAAAKDSTTSAANHSANQSSGVRRDSKHRASPMRVASPPINVNIPEYSFDFTPRLSFQTDFTHKDPFQKLIKYSPSANLIFSAGSEGVIRFWSFPDYKEVLKFTAHEIEVDDMDVHPAGTHLISISRDGRNFIWNTFNGNLVTTLGHDQFIPKHSETNPKGIVQNVKYFAKKCRYGTVEGDQTNVRLFLILNPPPLSKTLPSYLVKWHVNNDQYLFEKFAPAGRSLSALGISDNGRFIATGANNGDVDVYIAFSLQRCYRVPAVHKFFVTGVEFLPSTQASMELVGNDAETALISVCGGQQIVLHKIPKRATLGFFGSAWFFIVFMFCVYLMMNYLNL